MELVGRLIVVVIIVVREITTPVQRKTGLVNRLDGTGEQGKMREGMRRRNLLTKPTLMSSARMVHATENLTTRRKEVKIRISTVAGNEDNDENREELFVVGDERKDTSDFEILKARNKVEQIERRKDSFED